MDQAFAAGANAGRNLGGLLMAALTGNRALKQKVYDATQQQMANQYRTAQEGRKYSVDADLGQNRLDALGNLKPAYAGAGLTDAQATLAATIANAAKDPGIGEMLASALKLGSVNRADAGNTQGANAMLAAVSGKPMDYTKIDGDTIFNPNMTPDKSGMAPTQVGMGDITAKMAAAAASKASAANSYAGARANDALAKLRDVQTAAGGFNPHTGGDNAAPPPAANPNGPHGVDYLGTLDPTTAAQVKALSEGRMAFPSGTALKSNYWQAMLQHVAQFDPSFDQVNYNARAATRKGFTSGKEAQTINALNTVAEHLGTFSDYTKDLDNTRFPVINRVKNWLASQTGDPDIARFNTAKKAVADEVAKVWRASGGSEADIQENLRNLDGAQSPAQLNAAIGTLTKLIHGKISALQDQYKSGMGTTENVRPLVSPEAQAAFDKTLKRAGEDTNAFDKDAGALGGDGGAKPSTPTTEAEYNALPSGALFIDPDDGKTYRKP